MRRALVVASLLAASLTGMLGVSSCAGGPAAADWRPLFDGASLAGWEATGFGGDGEVRVEDGAIRMDMGSPLTGITRRDGVPSGAYELRVVAARMLGNDFFCALTFPVGNDHLTVVLGGWGGTVCGFSNLDGLDANHNGSRALRSFETGRDYELVVRVDADSVTATVDGTPLARTDRTGVRIGLRNEMLPCVPLSVSAFSTEARVRSIAWRPLHAR